MSQAAYVTTSILSIFLECLYQYLRQPPSEVECNPYSTSDSLAIQCQISIPVASSAEIRWFHDDSLITQDSFPLLESIMVEDATSNRVITSTIVFDESSFGDQYSGEYYCKMVVNGNVYESSNTLELLREDHYIFYNPCTENDVAVSEAVRCVQSSVPTVASPVTLTTAVTTPGGTTNQPSSAPPPASSSSSSRAPPSPSPSSSALPLVTSMPTTTVGIPAASTAAAPALWMYILIALVVALVLITISMATGVGILCHQVRTEGEFKINCAGNMILFSCLIGDLGCWPLGLLPNHLGQLETHMVCN